MIQEVQDAARVKGVPLPILKAGTESEIDAAFAALTQLQAGASSPALMCSSAAGPSSSWRWQARHAVRRFISGGISPQRAA